MPKTWLIEVETGSFSHYDAVVEFALDDYSSHAQVPYLQVSEVAGNGAVICDGIPCQLDDTNGKGTLVCLLPGATPACSTRELKIAETVQPQRANPLVELTDGVMHQEQESYRIVTPRATYFYHKQGAGFASLFDLDGNDWLSYRPYGGSDGIYRGIPNLAHPENHFHPGGSGCASHIVNAGPLKVTIASESLDGKWACKWEIFPAHARLTVLKADHPYWFLYEGTPGGTLDEAGDFCVISDGTRRPLAERWEQVLPDPKWIYFGASDCQRVLFLANHDTDQHIDSYWPMEKNMTVFGFGRNGLEKYLTRAPAQFTIGLAEDVDFDSLTDIIGSVMQPPAVRTKA